MESRTTETTHWPHNARDNKVPQTLLGTGEGEGNDSAAVPCTDVVDMHAWRFTNM